MFKKKVIALSIFLILLGVGMGVFLTIPNAEEVEHYRKLVENTDAVMNEKESYTAKQQRDGVQKQILYSEEGNRLHVQLDSEHSDMVLEHREDATEVVEHLKKVKCHMQEELYYILDDGTEVVKKSNGTFALRQADASKDIIKLIIESEQLIPMQMVRYFEADSATYHYQKERLVAEQVKLSRYVIPGHQPFVSIENLKPVITGDADFAEFSIGGKVIDFKATHLRAKFQLGDQ